MIKVCIQTHVKHLLVWRKHPVQVSFYLISFSSHQDLLFSESILESQIHYCIWRKVVRVKAVNWLDSNCKCGGSNQCGYSLGGHWMFWQAWRHVRFLEGLLGVVVDGCTVQGWLMIGNWEWRVKWRQKSAGFRVSQNRWHSYIELNEQMLTSCSRHF